MGRSPIKAMLPFNSPLRVTVRLSNNRLKVLREELGLTVREFAERVGMSYATYLDYEGLRTSPIGRDGDWLPSARCISEYHGLEPAELWPEDVLSIERPVMVAACSALALQRGHMPLALSEHEVLADSVGKETQAAQETPEERLTEPAGDEYDARLAEQIREVLTTLTPREEKVLYLRFGIGKEDIERLMELRAVGDEFELSTERIRQIEGKALRKLRHPSRAKRLVLFTERAVRESSLPPPPPNPENGLRRSDLWEEQQFQERVLEKEEDHCREKEEKRSISHTRIVACRFDVGLLRRVDLYVERRRKLFPTVSFNRSDAIRALLTNTLDRKKG